MATNTSIIRDVDDNTNTNTNNNANDSRSFSASALSSLSSSASTTATATLLPSHQSNNTHQTSRTTSIIAAATTGGRVQQRSSLSLATSGYSSEAILLLGERVLALYDVAEGMKFLHSHRIVFRDLKTENICSGGGVGSISSIISGDRHRRPSSSGVPLTTPSTNEKAPITYYDYNIHTQRRMQIFDFGLARECKLTDRVQLNCLHHNDNTTHDKTNGITGTKSSHHNRSFLLSSSSSSPFYDTYRMTGLTGTLRIMAPVRNVISIRSPKIVY